MLGLAAGRWGGLCFQGPLTSAVFGSPLWRVGFPRAIFQVPFWKEQGWLQPPGWRGGVPPSEPRVRALPEAMPKTNTHPIPSARARSLGSVFLPSPESPASGSAGVDVGQPTAPGVLGGPRTSLLSHSPLLHPQPSPLRCPHACPHLGFRNRVVLSISSAMDLDRFWIFRLQVWDLSFSGPLSHFPAVDCSAASNILLWRLSSYSPVP